MKSIIIYAIFFILFSTSFSMKFLQNNCIEVGLNKNWTNGFQNESHVAVYTYRFYIKNTCPTNVDIPVGKELTFNFNNNITNYHVQHVGLNGAAYPERLAFNYSVNANKISLTVTKGGIAKPNTEYNYIIQFFSANTTASGLLKLESITNDLEGNQVTVNVTENSAPTPAPTPAPAPEPTPAPTPDPNVLPDFTDFNA